MIADRGGGQLFCIEVELRPRTLTIGILKEHRIQDVTSESRDGCLCHY